MFPAVMMCLVLVICLPGSNAVAGEPFVFGYQTDFTGVARASYAPIAEGFKVYIDMVNDKGGVNGHPIKVIYEDDKSQPAMAGGIAEKLITKDNVLAILGLGLSRSQPPVLGVAGKAGVAVVTGYSAIRPIFPPKPTKNYFSVGDLLHPKALPQGYGNAYVCSKLHPGGRVAVTSFDTPGGRFVNNWGEGWSKKLGLNVVFRDEYPANTQDFSPWLSKIAKAKPDVILATAGGAIYVPFLRQMEKFGLEKTDVVIVDFVNEGDIIKGINQLSIGNGENVIVLSRYASSLDPDRPAEFENIAAALKKYGSKYRMSALHSYGWILGCVVEAALQKVDWPCSRESFIAAMEKTNLDTKGLTGGPIQFSSTDHYGPTWWKAYRWDAKIKGLKTALDWFKVGASEIVGTI